jgi:hypothetical protein
VTKLIYVGGFGHSGSTLFEYLMAGSPSVMACGEVVSAIRERESTRKKKMCSCGRAAAACPVWGFFHSPVCAPLNHGELLHELMKRADGQYSAIIDSSKTAWGFFGAPFRLKRRFGSDFVLVHLMRQPAGVCWSVLRKKSRGAEREGRKPYHYALRCGFAVAAWSVANLSCELFGLLYPRHYLRLRYEDLVRSPGEALPSLFERILPTVRWNFSESVTFDNRHQLHGNSIRRKQLALADVKEDLSWQSEMPAAYARLIHTLSSPLRWRYGY